MQRPVQIRTEDDPTTRIWASKPFRLAGAEPQDASSVHSREQIRSAILAALESAASSPAFRAASASTSGIVLAPLRPRPNPFLQPPDQSDPPAPWAAAYGWSRRCSHRRRSNVAIAAIVMALAIGFGLVVDHGRSGRSAMVEAGSRIVLAHGAKVLVHHRARGY
jgi:hypothetical protein